MLEAQRAWDTAVAAQRAGHEAGHQVAAEPELDEQEPDVDDEPPHDYGPPGSGAVITEWP
jgi:hypothetical protein